MDSMRTQKSEQKLGHLVIGTGQRFTVQYVICEDNYLNILMTSKRKEKTSTFSYEDCKLNKSGCF